MKRAPVNKLKLFFESFLATILVFLATWLLFYVISISFKPFNYVVKAIKEVQLTDIYFSKLSNNTVDTSIIIVNIEDLNREGIALLLDRINTACPKAIGMDVFFSHDADTNGTTHLTASISHASPRLVMASFEQDDVEKNQHNDTEYLHFKNAAYGYADIMSSPDRTAVVRVFIPQKLNTGRESRAFSVQIAKIAFPNAYEKLKARENKEEMINYLGDVNSFPVLNHSEIINASNDQLKLMFKEKVVLVGYTGGKCLSENDMEDRYYTPVNDHFYGRSHPDMFGIGIHANILSMIRRSDYIKQIPFIGIFILSFIIVFLHMVIFSLIFIRHHLWFHVATKLFQLVSFGLILYLVFLIFQNFHILIPTKLMLLGVILSAEILSFYELIVLSFHKSLAKHSLFIIKH